MNFHLYQQKLSQLENRLKGHFSELLLNNKIFVLSDYVDAICVFINDFDVVEFFGENIINDSYLTCYLNIDKYETELKFRWDFITDDEIDQDRNMIYISLIFADRYEYIELSDIHKGGKIYHSVHSEEIYKVQFKGENIFFDVNLELSLQNIISDIHYQAMKNEEPIAMSIYSYSDN